MDKNWQLENVASFVLPKMEGPKADLGTSLSNLFRPNEAIMNKQEI